MNVPCPPDSYTTTINQPTIRRVPLTYINIKKPTYQDASNIHQTLINLSGNEHCKTVQDTLDHMNDDRKSLYNHACESVKKQIGENAHILKLTKDNLHCYSIKDFRDLWASTEGLQKHNLIWQVSCIYSLLTLISFHIIFHLNTNIIILDSGTGDVWFL